MNVRILHNPRCSKSRTTLALLQERGIDPEITHYLDSPPCAEELRSILKMLGMQPRELMRRGESEYRMLGLDQAGLGDDELIDAMVAHPRLIERPIVIANHKAAIGRPLQAVLDIL